MSESWSPYWVDVDRLTSLFGASEGVTGPWGSIGAAEPWENIEGASCSWPMLDLGVSCCRDDEGRKDRRLIHEPLEDIESLPSAGAGDSDFLTNEGLRLVDLVGVACG